MSTASLIGRDKCHKLVGWKAIIPKDQCLWLSFSISRCLWKYCREGNGTPLQYSCLEKYHGQRSLVGCSPLGGYESDTTGHDWATSFSLFTFTHWRRKWQPTPVFLPWESQGQGSLVGCHLWGRTESDMTEST